MLAALAYKSNAGGTMSTRKSETAKAILKVFASTEMKGIVRIIG